jgi:undecaprenyl diphosphate synthase
MGLLRRHLQHDIAKLAEEGVRLCVIGERERLPIDIVRLIGDAEEQTKSNDRITVAIAISYGSRQEIAAAARYLAAQAVAGKIEPDAIDEEVFAACLMTADMPDPDLVVRTSGEQRISNFLLWQSAYSELIFIDKLWPDFDKEDLAEAIREFQQRDRRYGAVASSG